mgnify:CR=1 FL=1
MASSKGTIRFLAGSRVFVKILLLLILYLAMLCVPLLAKGMVTTAIGRFDENSPYDVTMAPNIIYNLLFNGFMLFIGALFVVNLFFRLIDERLNDTVPGRRVLQVTLNILLILGGGIYLLYITYMKIPSYGWWADSDLFKANDLGNALYWGGALLYVVCATILSVLDLKIFAPENRKPVYRKNKIKKQAMR